MVDRVRTGLGPQAVPRARDRREPGSPRDTGGTGFKAVLEERLSGPKLRFSAHAQQRLRAGGIRLSPTQLADIARAAERAAAKGSRDSLVLLPDLALVVSVKNRTVVTAVEGARMKDNIFTNIDSAVILDTR